MNLKIQSYQIRKLALPIIASTLISSSVLTSCEPLEDTYELPMVNVDTFEKEDSLSSDNLDYSKVKIKYENEKEEGNLDYGIKTGIYLLLGLLGYFGIGKWLTSNAENKFKHFNNKNKSSW